MTPWCVRSLAGVLLGLLTSPAAHAGAPAPGVPPTRLAVLARGINLSTALDPAVSVPQLRADLGHIHRAGFRHVRIFVSPDWIIAETARTRPQTKLRRLDQVVAQAVRDGLGVILCMTADPHDALTDADAASAAPRWQAAWQTLARRYATVSPARMFFELANEPGITDAAHWAAIQEQLRATVRQAVPHDTILLTGSPLSMSWSLPATVTADTDTAYTFHLYQPMVFTHQGADWPGASQYRDFAGLAYPPDPANIARIAQQLHDPATHAMLHQYGRIGDVMMDRDIAAATAWTEAHHRALVVTEFGVFQAAPTASRAAWLGQARRHIEAAGFGWTLWEYQGGFGVKGAVIEGCDLITRALDVC